ncbi:MAG: DUF3703 domain-containing protein [Gammaproteobacteria bacterium]|nr:DUF3703 domain-containing protein [Gammaproteobacteria bacterium]
MNRSRLACLLDQELARYRDMRQRGDKHGAWSALERAHIISQSTLGAHLRVHGVMLGYAFALRDGREIAGQILRLALAPLGSLTGRIPSGNTGRSNMNAFATLPLPADLAAALDQIDRDR